MKLDVAILARESIFCSNRQIERSAPLRAMRAFKEKSTPSLGRPLLSYAFLGFPSWVYLSKHHYEWPFTFPQPMHALCIPGTFAPHDPHSHPPLQEALLA